MRIKLLATDLDGTLFGKYGELPLYGEFRKRLKTLRVKHDALWVISTGRSLRSFKHLFSPMEMMDIAPDYVIIKHAYIYQRKRNSYRPHYIWNFLIRYHIWSSRLYMKEAIQKWYRMVMDTTDGVTTVYHQRNRLCLRFASEKDAQAVAGLLHEKAREFKHLRVFKFAKEVDIRAIPFTKGLALEELSTRLGIGASTILSIGNGHNDISMLDGIVAKATGCPNNAETDVMATVNKSGGHIAPRPFLGGVIDVIDAYLEDSVNSELPARWVANTATKNPKSTMRQMNHPPKEMKHHKRKTITICIIIMIVYAVLLAFANFGVIPFSGLIRKPVSLIMGLLVNIIELISAGFSKMQASG